MGFRSAPYGAGGFSWDTFPGFRSRSIRGYFRDLPPGEIRGLTGWSESMNPFCQQNSFMRLLGDVM
jgi:hypothetical protein